MNLAILMMLCSAEIIVRGLYGDLVEYTAVIAGGLLILGLMYTHYRMQGLVNKKVHSVFVERSTRQIDLGGGGTGDGQIGGDSNVEME